MLPQAYRPTGRAAAGDVFVQLFEWSWLDIATECERVLGPAGYRAAYVSPPQEAITLSGRPWWERYQPVSYHIDQSRSGTRAEFITMVTRCRAAAVDIYVDGVINHMTAGAGTGTNGTTYTKYQYPNLYAPTDFHVPCSVNNYQDEANVQDCELFGLADLNTGSATVQQTIADYLIALGKLGVAGFRVDAAKHIQPVELDGIVARGNAGLAAAGRPLPYVFLEVSDPGTEAVHASDYFGLGFTSGGGADLTEFGFRGTGDKFLNKGGRVANLSAFSQRTWGLMPSDKAVVFLENHDTQRAGGISYRDGNSYRLANVWMLAQPYGYPVVMSGYAFDIATQAGRDKGPPPYGGDAPGGVQCATPMETAVPGQWVCEHRDPWITRAVAFRRAVAGADINTFWDDGADAVAFSRGSLGFVAINNRASAITATVPSNLPAGAYCDLLTGGRAGTSCAGRAVTVAADRSIALTLGSKSALLLSATQRP